MGRSINIHYLLFSFAVILGLNLCNAQVYIGPKAGYQTSIMLLNNPDTLDRTFVASWMAGVSLMSQTHKNLGFQVELLYSNKGMLYYVNDTKTSYELRLSYAELPILTHAFLRFGQRLRGFVLAGAQVSYLFAGKEIRSGEEFVDQTFGFNLSEFNRLVYGVTGGLGVNYAIGTSKIQLELRYTHDIGYAYTNQLDYRPRSSQNQVFGANLTYFLPLSKGKKESEN